MGKTRWAMIALCCFGIFVAGAALPTRKANLDFVRTATAMKIMQELKEPGIALRVKAEPGGKRDISLIAGRAVELKFQADGLRTETKTIYSFNGQTKSYCMEIEPGCLEILHSPFSKSVSVRVPM